MTTSEKINASLEIQRAYAAQEIDYSAARTRLIEIDGSPDLADEVLGNIDGESDIARDEQLAPRTTL
jgi:hypothetical protein